MYNNDLKTGTKYKQKLTYVLTETIEEDNFFNRLFSFYIIDFLMLLNYKTFIFSVSNLYIITTENLL